MKVIFNCCPRPSFKPLFKGEDKKPEVAPAPVAEQPVKKDTVEITNKPAETQSKTVETVEKKCEGPDCKK